MDEGRFSISPDVLYHRLGSAAVGARGIKLPPWVAIFRFKTGTLQPLLACSAAGLFLHLVGAVR